MDTNTTNKSQRNSNHELLRIIAMFMIVMVHVCNYSNYFFHDFGVGVFNGVINGVCNIGVTCFVLISGFYGMKFRFEKLVKMELMMITYSLFELLILFVAFPVEMRGATLLEQIIKSFFPFITRKYWFYSCYICIYLFSGFIQRFLDTLKKNELRILLGGMLVLFSILPTVFYFEIIPDNGKGLVQMLMIYLIGRYIGMYHDEITEKINVKTKVIGIVAFFVLWTLNGLSHEVFPIQISGIYHHLCKDNSITNIVMALILFILFDGMTFKSGAVNYISGFMFAVFALNNSLVNIIMAIIKRTDIYKLIKGFLGFPLIMGLAFSVFILCILIGMGREVLLQKPDKWLAAKLSKVWDKICVFSVREL